MGPWQMDVRWVVAIMKDYFASNVQCLIWAQAPADSSHKSARLYPLIPVDPKRAANDNHKIYCFIFNNLKIV